MNKKELIEVLAEKTGLTKADTGRFIDSFVDVVKDTLKASEEIAIAGFGKFHAPVRAARTVRNPRTGESIELPDTKVPKFKAGKALKDIVKEG